MSAYRSFLHEDGGAVSEGSRRPTADEVLPDRPRRNRQPIGGRAIVRCAPPMYAQATSCAWSADADRLERARATLKPPRGGAVVDVGGDE